MGMGVHDPGCHFYKFADMSHKKDAFYPHVYCHINGLAYVVAALDIPLKGQCHMLS